MSNLTATSGHFENPNMSNVIDALKRLERIGSEHSETTKKIIEAAMELSNKIDELYPPEVGDVQFVPQPMAHRARVDSYGLLKRRGTDSRRGVYNDESGGFVDSDRRFALEFAEDIANGLLDRIERDLRRRAAQDREALARLQPALEKLKKRPIAWVRHGATMFSGEEIEYEVENMPNGRRAFIAQFRGRWKIMLAENEVQTDWMGDYETADLALLALQEHVESTRS